MLLKHQTQAQFIKRLRDEFRGAEGERAVQLGKYLLDALVQGDISDAEMRGAFGKTPAQWAAFRTTLQNRVNSRDAVRAVRGE